MPKRKQRKRLPKIVKITGEQFWKLRAQAEETAHAETKKKLVEKQVELLSLRIAVCNDKVSERQKDLESSREEYDKIKLEIEEDLGQSLEDCNIDPTNYTVHKGV